MLRRAIRQLEDDVRSLRTDDAARVFSDFLGAGEHVFEYTARATIPGEFAALPAEVEAMYEPEVRGRTPGSTLKVRK